MNSFTLLFLLFLILSTGVEYWLGRRHLRHVAAHRDQVPDAFSAAIDLDAHQKAADYTVARGNLGQIERIVGAVILLLITLGGITGNVLGFWAQTGWNPIFAGAAGILSVLIITQIFDLPFSIYQTFVIEEKYGFNRNTPRQFVTDMALQLGLMLAIGGVMFSLLIWVMTALGSYWWIFAWALVMGFSILMSWAFPTFIAPLFNKFSPLEDTVLRDRIQRLLERCGFQSKGIFVMDGSKRSGHGNAYFTGIGNNKRIVFFDTLVASLSHDELEAVLAHELGHFKCNHIIKSLIVSSIATLIGFALLGWLSTQPWFYSGLGVQQASPAAALLLFMLVSPVFTVFTQPIAAYLQRRHEFEADDFAARLAKPNDLISALVKLYRDNASTLTPDPLYSAFHYSHPPASIRIANLETKTATS